MESYEEVLYKKDDKQKLEHLLWPQEGTENQFTSESATQFSPGSIVSQLIICLTPINNLVSLLHVKICWCNKRGI